MRYTDMQEWLGSGDAERYDFVEDTQVAEGNMKTGLRYRDYREIPDSFEKFSIYKMNTSASGDKPNWKVLRNIKDETQRRIYLDRKAIFLRRSVWYENVDDPDSASDLLQEIYRNLFGELADQPFMLQDGRIGSDTMTSAQTRFTDAMQKIVDKGYEPKEDDPRVIKEICDIGNACGKYQRCWWSKNFSVMTAALLERKAYVGLIRENLGWLETFLNLCHSIGNYCPVPEGFNGARSGSFADHDYWDLTLMKIREWYLYAGTDQTERDNLIQRDLLHGRGYQLNCIRWLAWFGEGENGWRAFVDSLYMNDYVDETTYEVIPFWSGHGWNEANGERIGLPDTIGEINQGLEVICNRILERGRRIVEACQSQFGQPEEEQETCSTSA